MKRLFMAIFWLIFLVSPGLTLTPEEILILVNKNSESSIELGKYYQEKRNIPHGNFLSLDLPPQENCTREDYNTKVKLIINQFMDSNGIRDKISCFLTTYDLPLRISQIPDERIKGWKKEVEEKIKELDAKTDKSQKLWNEKKRIKSLLGLIDKGFYKNTASFDSELCLVGIDEYTLNGFLPNPLHGNFLSLRSFFKRVYMVSRLDAPTIQIAKNLVDMAIATEEKGLKGKVYLDARGLEYKKGENNGNEYSFYDELIRETAKLLKEKSSLEVVLDNEPALFASGACPDAALYFGWYRQAQYKDAFDWQPGAIGVHLASSECITLHIKDSQVWCKKMLEDGITATFGPVSEPFLASWPRPNQFFGLLITGEYTLAECYSLSNPCSSWVMVLIGDPLYTPFKNIKN